MSSFIRMSQHTENTKLL